jgi:enoyl-CoA hydratase/carnithine racemase
MGKVLYEQRGRIAYITLNRPESLNAVDDELDAALWSAWAQFNSDDALEIALACDFRIAGESAQFASFEVRRGLHQGDGGIVRILAIAGLAVALDLALTGRVITAEEAYRLGLVNRVVPDDQLMTTAEELANQQWNEAL